jgi:ribose 5-phosphate isomerase B
MKKIKIGIACDHAGFDYKEQLKKYLSSSGKEITDYGCFSLESVDYPDFAHKLSESIENGENNLGIQFCGTGNGINMSANKHQGIRAALCWNEHIAEQARLHNNANVLTMPARHLEWNEVKEIVDIFLNTNFEGGRHEKRVNKIKLN